MFEKLNNVKNIPFDFSFDFDDNFAQLRIIMKRIRWYFARGTFLHISFYLTAITMDRIPVPQVPRRMRAGSPSFLPITFSSYNSTFH